jgi:activating signal cointegrator 1
MKALSLHQPWATLVCIGAKRLETRSWKTSYRGTIAIHASKTRPPTGLHLATKEPFKSALAKAGIFEPGQLLFGQVIGMATVIECHIAEHLDAASGLINETEWAFGDFRSGRWAWQLSNPVLFKKPFIYKGRVGIFDIEDDLIKEAM